MDEVDSGGALVMLCLTLSELFLSTGIGSEVAGCVLFNKLHDISKLVIDLCTDLGERNASFITPGLSCTLGNVHVINKFGIVDEDFLWPLVQD